MTPFGSMIARAARRGEVTLRTADGISFEVGPKSRSRWALRLLGLPHVGLRMRAQLLLRWLEDRIPPGGSRPVLDLGCGIGVYSLELGSRTNRPIVGIDLDLEKVRTAARMSRDLGLGCWFVVGDAENLPFQDDAFGAILCSEVLEHIEHDGRALSEMNRTMGPGGMLFLSTTAISEITEAVEDDMGHARTGYTRHGLSSRVERNGLRVHEILPYGMRFGALAWTLNRWSFASRVLLAFTFVPLLLLSRLDDLLRRRPFDERCIIGWVVAAEK